MLAAFRNSKAACLAWSSKPVQKINVDGDATYFLFLSLFLSRLDLENRNADTLHPENVQISQP